MEQYYINWKPYPKDDIPNLIIANKLYKRPIQFGIIRHVNNKVINIAFSQKFPFERNPKEEENGAYYTDMIKDNIDFLDMFASTIYNYNNYAIHMENANKRRLEHLSVAGDDEYLNIMNYIEYHYLLFSTDLRAYVENIYINCFQSYQSLPKFKFIPPTCEQYPNLETDDKTFLLQKKSFFVGQYLNAMIQQTQKAQDQWPWVLEHGYSRNIKERFDVFKTALTALLAQKQRLDQCFHIPGTDKQSSSKKTGFGFFCSRNASTNAEEKEHKPCCAIS